MRSGNYLLLFTLFILLCCSIDGNAQIITTIAGTGTYGFGLDGIPATSSQLAAPTRVIPGAAGSVYIADLNAYRVRKVDATGVITTIAGAGLPPGYSGDGGPATAAEMNEPLGIAMDTAGDIYIVDLTPHVRKVNSLGIISTIAGATYGYSGDGGPATAAQLGAPGDIATDNFGNIYISDAVFHCIRKIDAAGIITTVAGTSMPGYSGDGGPATAAQLHQPTGVTADNYGNLYIADNLNNCIRKVNAAGVITTVAGNDTAGYTGDGYAATAAELNSPWKAALDGLGNLYIADANNNCVRKVNTLGIITTIAGSGTASAGYGGDNGPASAALFNVVRGISLDAAANIYIADVVNQRIRKITVNDHAPSFTSGVQAFTVCENAGDTALNALLAITDIDTGQAETWTLMSGPFHGTATVAYTTASTGAALTPSGLSYAPATGYSGQDTFTERIDDGTSVGFTTIYVTINPLPNPGIITGPDTVCEGAHITLSDTSGVGVWSSSGTAAAVSGGIVTGIATGIDTIGYTLTNGCGATTAVLSVSVKDCTSAVSDIQLTNGSLTVYPNPASTELIITSTNTINQISISNILGQEITTPSKSLQNKEVWLNIAVLPAGVYFVKVNGSEVRRFVKE